MRQFETAYDLLEYARTITEIPDDGAEETIEWFVALQEAHFVSTSASTKDMAHLFLDGIEPYHGRPDRIQEWIDTFYEDAEYAEELAEDGDEDAYASSEEAYAEANENIRQLLEDHFGEVAL